MDHLVGNISGNSISSGAEILGAPPPHINCQALCYYISRATAAAIYYVTFHEKTKHKALDITLRHRPVEATMFMFMSEFHIGFFLLGRRNMAQSYNKAFLTLVMCPQI